VIRYALACAAGHEFEGWFASSADYDDQESGGLMHCPVCNSSRIAKQIMAPGVVSQRSGYGMMEAINQLRDHVEATYENVGDAFASEARAIHEGKAETREIFGQATPREVERLVADGVPVAALPPRPPAKRQMN